MTKKMATWQHAVKDWHTSLQYFFTNINKNKDNIKNKKIMVGRLLAVHLQLQYPDV